jgi:hypothetical protein
LAYILLEEHLEARFFLIYLQFALTIQLAEFFAWKQYLKTGHITATTTSWLFCIVILQPIILLICSILAQLYIGKLNILHIIVAVLLIYIYVLFYVCKIMKNKWTGLEPTNECPHIKLAFGDETVYFLTTVAALAIAPPIEGTSLLLIGTIAKIISNVVYGCSAGSIWCALAALFPILFAESVIVFSG